MKWKLKQQEREGTYHFNGLFLATSGVATSVPLEEINAIYALIRKEAKTHNGIDYFQVLEHEETGQQLFFIDQLNKEMIASGGFAKEDNHCTLLFPHEY